jgi:hypothetical protein
VEVTVPGAGIPVDVLFVNVAASPPQVPARAAVANIVAPTKDNANQRMRELFIWPP